ncbi:unnamed protein product [Leuciscus chuanchicus]
MHFSKSNYAHAYYCVNSPNYKNYRAQKNKAFVDTHSLSLVFVRKEGRFHDAEQRAVLREERAACFR